MMKNDNIMATVVITAVFLITGLITAYAIYIQ